ncbi:MAG TPA: Ig-like domain-containing protein [Actinomycetota bacterium]|nr:Ig-like domain-containing protein [Actinomycetota bacterium]
MSFQRVVRALAATIVPALIVSVLPAASAPASASVVPVSSNAGCDPIDPTACLLPFPNDYFTVPDASTATGLRVNLNPAAMPRNGADVTNGGEGKPVDPTEWNRNDGFSPGSMIMTYVPDLDLHVTWGTQDRPHSNAGPTEQGYFDYRDQVTDIGLYKETDAPIVLINAETGERHPFWSELDTHPDAVGAGEQTLIIRPARNLEEGTRYIVALRNLKRTDGSVIDAGSAFESYVQGDGADADRQDHYNQDIFPVLDGAGVAKDDLYLAWDFTVASEDNLAGRILHMRDDAFERVLGDTDLSDRIVEGDSPDYTIDRVDDSRVDNWTDSNGVQHSQPVRRVYGRVMVPNYLDRIQQTEAHFKPEGQAGGVYYDAPAPGSRLLDITGDGLPDQNPVESFVNVPFVCEMNLNHTAQNVTLYGHGLLGTRDQVGDIKSPRRYGPFAGCAADWWGMSSDDLPTVAATLADMSNFPSLPDRAQQGFLNFMFLGRAAVHPEGFVNDPAFQQDGKPLINVATDTDTPLYYDGNSQGGIMGGSLVAVSPDIKRAILGVPGMNYSTLLNRSVDWEGDYGAIMYANYTDPIERQLVFGLIQMLWDRGEANGYAHHMTTDPYPNTPSHEVMLQVAFGDYQVTNVAAETEARTIGAPILTPGLAPGRHWEMNPYFTPTSSYPYRGSAMIYWDSGNVTPPNGNLPNDDGHGDPHSHPRNEPAAGWQEAEFLLTGWMLDVCNGGYYLTLRNPINGGTPSCHAPTWAPGSVDPRSSSTAFTADGDDSGQYGDQVTLQAKVVDSVGAPIDGAPVTFTLGGGGSSRTFEATTGNDGVATVTPVLTERPGTYELTAAYAGDADHDPSSVSTSFVVEKEDTATSLTGSGKPSRRTLTAGLRDSDSGAPIAGRTITFYADGTAIGTATTSADGTATLVIPSRYQGGHHDFTARFAGDDFYLSSEGAWTS